jgi:hypothetical protein
MQRLCCGRGGGRTSANNARRLRTKTFQSRRRKDAHERVRCARRLPEALGGNYGLERWRCVCDIVEAGSMAAWAERVCGVVKCGAVGRSAPVEDAPRSAEEQQLEALRLVWSGRCCLRIASGGARRMPMREGARVDTKQVCSMPRYKAGRVQHTCWCTQVRKAASLRRRDCCLLAAAGKMRDTGCCWLLLVKYELLADAGDMLAAAEDLLAVSGCCSAGEMRAVGGTLAVAGCYWGSASCKLMIAKCWLRAADK